MAASKMAPSSGCAARYSQTPLPCTDGNAVSPVRTLCSKWDQACQT